MKLLNAVRARMRTRHLSRATEQAYVGWIRRYIVHHGRCHPREMGEREVGGFLTALAVEGHVAAATQNQALAALQFLYNDVLGLPLAIGDDVIRAKRPHRLPEVLTRAEVAIVIAHMRGVSRLIARMLYGSGLRIGEGIALRVKDVDVAERIITVRGGKGNKDRMTVLAESMVAPLMEQLNAVRALHARDLASRRSSQEYTRYRRVRPWRKFVVGRELVQSEQRANRAGRVRNMQLTRKKLCCK